MADDWQVGDLALCVNTGDRVVAGRNNIAGRRFRQGAIYTVEAVLSCSATGMTPGVHLRLMEDPAGLSAGAWRFRKIRPHTPDEQDAETIALLNGHRIPVEA